MVRFSRAGVAAFMGALFLMMASVGCGSAGETSQASQTTPMSQASQASQTSQTTAEAPAEQFTRENWSELVSDPEAYKGARVDIVGRLLGAPERRDDGAYWQMYVDPRNYEWNTSVRFADPSFAVAADDFVHVTGTVRGALNGENAFGEQITLVAVLADTAEVVDALAAASPASRTTAVNQSVDQHGIVIAVEKVEFAPDETRVFVKVTNGSAATATLYDLSAATAMQEETLYDAEPQWDYYPNVEWELLPGMVSSGIIVFPAMKPSQPVKIYLEAGSDDYELLFEPYIFDVPRE